MFAENFRKNFTKIGHFVYYRNTQYEICETETIRNFFETGFALTTNTPTAAAPKKRGNRKPLRSARQAFHTLIHLLPSLYLVWVNLHIDTKSMK